MNEIPSTFENFSQRKLGSGNIETMSETTYNGYAIRLRSFPNAGIKYIIYKSNNEKRIKLRIRCFNYCDPHELLQKAKDYIDNYGSNLIEKFNRLSKQKV